MRQDLFHGILIDAAFKDKKYPEKYSVFSKRVSRSNDWVLYGIEISRSNLKNAIYDIQENMRADEDFYTHLYDDKVLIVIFKDKVFKAKPHISSWSEIIKHGLKLGIKEEQLDFWPNRFQDDNHYFQQ